MASCPNIEEARQTLSTGLRKMDAAEQRRLDLQVKVQEACREQLEVVIQKVDAAEKMKEEKRQAKHQKIIQKELELQERLRAREEEELEDEESSAEGHELSPRKQGVRGPSKESHHELRVVEPKKEEIQEEAPSPTSPKIMSYYSKELIVANSRAHKEYVQRCGKLQQAGFEMLAKKQFKVLADAAHIREDDAPAARMRSLHEKYLSENGKGRYKPPSGAVTARTPRRKVPTCGLCERHFPLESLIGSTLGKTLQKIKDSNDLPDLCSASQASGAMTCPTSPSATDRAPDAGTSQVEERILPGVRLYDTEVPLCAACYHRVRISSSSKA
ncbi:Hypothetical protein (Fragment) [Durusdinium trenchii]|uniref:Uncharacterized protein n=1 Tax=Durusdinium trenchii TaxID=1381693 RepID=A0ABP0H9A7_9DINO